MMISWSPTGIIHMSMCWVESNQVGKPVVDRQVDVLVGGEEVDHVLLR